MSYGKKPLRLEVSPSEMMYLREQGMTNKQIANQIGCSVASVYRFIGKRSYAVQNAVAQNKPCPIPQDIATGYIAPKVIEEEIEEVTELPVAAEEVEEMPKYSQTPKTQQTQFVTHMPILKERRIMELQGEYCVFEVDTGDGTVVMKNGEEESAMVTGMLDRDALMMFCRELTQIGNLLGKEA